MQVLIKYYSRANGRKTYQDDASQVSDNQHSRIVESVYRM
jgi:hypothetical protein